MSCGKPLPEDANFCPRCGKERYKENTASNDHNVEILLTNPIIRNEKVIFGKWTKIYIYSCILGGALTALIFLFWTPSQYAPYGTFNWALNEAFRHMSSGYRTFLGISGIISTAAWASLLKFKARESVYVIVGWSILSSVISIYSDAGQNTMLMIISFLVGMLILYFIIRNHWEKMEMYI